MSLRLLLQKLRQFLLPEANGARGDDYSEPPDVLVAIYQRISALGDQIESHAELAPYPHVRRRLRQIAQEKYEIAASLNRIIEAVNGVVPKGSRLPAIGKNHWRRLVRDLEDQRELDNVIAQFEFTLLRGVPGISNFLDRVKTLHQRHREILVELIAVADPQASQT